MKGAVAILQPSSFESLSIVLLEGFMLGTPGVVNRKSAVLNDHIKVSGAGYSYGNQEEFSASLLEVIEPKNRTSLQENARAYYLNEYSLKSFKQRVFESFVTEV